MGAGIMEGLSFGVSSNLESYYSRNSEKTYIAGKIVGNGLTAIVSSFTAKGSGAAAIVTSPTGVGTVVFSGIAVYSATVTVSSVAHFTNNVAEFSKIKDDGVGEAVKGEKKAIPDKAKDIANQVKNSNGAAPKGYKGGRTYKNIPLEEGAQKLPEGINYKEYDINPYVKGQNRGAERIVVGDDGSVWYTNDHYFSFTKIE